MLYDIPPTHFFRDHSFEKETELTAIDAAICVMHPGHREATLLQPFIPDGEPVAVPI
jgi:hypothetical protein